MKNLIPILLALVVLSSGCDPDGYSCNSEECYAENNAQYLTLEDCLSACDEIDSNSAVFETCGDHIGHEGYNYSTVQIGSQCWFSENCRYLPEVSPSSEGSETDPYYYVYDYQGTDVASAMSTSNYDTYGALYNWPAVMTEDICPSGWHIPSDGEFAQLIDYLGGYWVAGYKMKSAGGWFSPEEDGNGSNSSGFNGHPGGDAYPNDDTFYFETIRGFWWSSSVSGSSAAWTHYLIYNKEYASRSDLNRDSGFSARCVQD